MVEYFLWEQEDLDHQPTPCVLDLKVTESEAGLRLDVFLTRHLEETSRSSVQSWIREGRVLVSERPCSKPSYKVKSGEYVLVEVPPLEPAEPKPDPEIPLDVVYEDEHLLVVNKQKGLVVHPARGHPDKTLVNALLYHCKDLSGIAGVLKPGIVHRLDKNTTGLMVVAKNDRSHIGLQAQFKERSVLKVYHALVHGVPQPASGRIEQPIARHAVDRVRMAVRPDGKNAISEYRVVERWGEQYSLLDVHILTGRTHQIRVHMAWLGNPVVGDPLYGRLKNSLGIEGQALHCRKLGFSHPVTGRELEFEAKLPPDFENALSRLRLEGCTYKLRS